ncbi:hypothetical protein [Agrobacterium sp. OT33]|uniref:hypothetical protein n=1 Tax=Agrobacterium sp. OT33 TaxID=2815338 RepID=UPI001A8D30D9|nr:hypothetical protein [Agrobacterium sp. OT33]MBO0125183.1 hypothetical protein [Agrobacterium sp. OT33]
MNQLRAVTIFPVPEQSLQVPIVSSPVLVVAARSAGVGDASSLLMIYESISFIHAQAKRKHCFPKNESVSCGPSTGDRVQLPSW